LGFKDQDEEGMTETKPRIISSASAHYNSVVGPWIAAIQAWLKKAHNSRVLFGVSDRAELGKWFSEHLDDLGLECDFSTFDATQSEELRLIIIDLYTEFLGLEESVARLMRMRAHEKRGYGVRGTKLVVPGTMASGDPDTYLSNTILNILVQFYAYTKATGLTAHQALQVYTIAASGDDSISFDATRQVELSVMEAAIAALGMSAKFVMHRDPSDPAKAPSYCSSIFIPIEGGEWFLSPKPGRLLAKLPWTVGDRRDLGQLRANALGVWSSVQHTPLAREYVAHIIASTQHVTATTRTERVWLGAGEVVAPHEVGDPTEAMLVVARYRYGIEAAEYHLWVRNMREHNLSQYPTVLIDGVVEVDTA
jgi:hypothetical protein